MSVSILSTAQDLSGGIWIDMLGQSSDWSHIVTYPGGDSTASWSFTPRIASSNDPAFQTGRRIFAFKGAAPIFAGRVDVTDKSQQPWAMTAIGQAALAKDYQSLTAGGTLNAIVDAAIARGLPWTRPASLTQPKTAVTVPSTVYDALNLLVADNLTWTVDVRGVVSTPAAPTSASYILQLLNYPARTLDGYFDVVYVLYTASGGGTATAKVSSTTGIVQAGTIETTLDVTDQGVLTLAQAQAIGQAAIAASAVPTWQAPFLGTRQTLFTMGGTAVDPAIVRPGFIVRLQALQVDNVSTSGPVEVLIGQTTYRDATPATVELLPAAAAPVDLVSVVTDLKKRKAA